MSKLYLISLLFIVFAAGCVQKQADDTNLIAVKDSITQLTNNTTKIITAKGPIGWLNVFENSPDFYMANDGALAFKDYPSAERFIRDTLSKHIEHIDLKFSNIKITALSSQSGSVGAVFNETLTVTEDKVYPVSGYFTATAHHTSTGWKWLNLHWSIRK